MKAISRLYDILRKETVFRLHRNDKENTRSQSEKGYQHGLRCLTGPYHDGDGTYYHSNGETRS